MNEIQKIDPETAAHNISTIFSEKYIESLKDPAVLSINDTKISEAATEAAKLYAIVYDAAYEQFTKENEDF